MVEVVAVVHPDAGVVGNEGDLVGLAVLHVQRVDPPRAAGGGHTVPAQDDGMVAVQMHGMHVAAAVADRHSHHVALGDDEHRYVGEQVTVD
jgi:hypothetical protein